MILLLALLAAGHAAESRHITVYAPQTTYQVDILLRDGVDYVGLTDLLEPLGKLESRVDGGKFTLIFNGAASEFQDGKRQYRTSANSKLEMAGKFLVVAGRGYVPTASVAQLLPKVANQSADFHAAARRLFVGVTPVHFTAELRGSPSRLVLSFTAPVSPSKVIEKGRVRLVFRREPIVGNGTDKATYDDPLVSSSTFTETADGAEFIANVQKPVAVSVSDGGLTLTIAAAGVPTEATAPGTSQGAAAGQHPANAHLRPFVILDAAHGGTDTGEALTEELQEKNVNLALVRRLQKELEARGVSVVLTRTGDALLSPDQRATSANTSHASLYLALHSSKSGHGVRIYTALIPAVQPSQGKHSFLPWEQAQAPYVGQSGVAASGLASECGSAGLPVRSSAVPLRPLNSVTLAAVAVEVAPLGSSADELSQTEYQQKIATTLAIGIASLRQKLETAP